MKAGLGNKKAAMFGLDARITLVIFVSLSIIAGFAVHSVIKNARIVAIKADMQEMAKAFEAYWLDTGDFIPRCETDLSKKKSEWFHMLSGGYLVDSKYAKENGIKNWKGPYLRYKRNSLNEIKYPKYKTFEYVSVDKDGHFGGGYGWRASKCLAGKKCTLLIEIGSNVDDETFHALDEMIDGGDGLTTGSLRGHDIEDGDQYGYIYYLPGIPLPNPIPNS